LPQVLERSRVLDCSPRSPPLGVTTGRSPHYQPIKPPRDKYFEPPAQRGISHKWGGKWITKTELRRQHWLNRTALKERGLSDRWLQHLERWLAQQKKSGALAA